MRLTRSRWIGVLTVALAAYPAVAASTADGSDYRDWAADKDITPPPGVPMWGYGARHDALCERTLDPLMGEAIVIAAGVDKVAIVGTDLGRGPTKAIYLLQGKFARER